MINIIIYLYNSIISYRFYSNNSILLEMNEILLEIFINSVYYMF